ncbi:hypothetical protein GIB67_020629 [Kingdonia uniflora]|uniref:Uncharacterized protein n=1 Tax=Kingdonia uniflora TaxID=39325 RepID=A0A7J7M943_9MAGN|nr:hypothetical protein GIB67_020629 [Kingdonia uniflora]
MPEETLDNLPYMATFSDDEVEVVDDTIGEEEGIRAVSVEEEFFVGGEEGTGVVGVEGVYTSIDKCDDDIRDIAKEYDNIFESEEAKAISSNPHILNTDLYIGIEWPTLDACRKLRYGLDNSYYTAWSAWTICMENIAGLYDEGYILQPELVRDKPIHKASEKLNLMLMKIIYDRRKKSKEWEEAGLLIVPRAHTHIGKITKLYSQYKIEGSKKDCWLAIAPANHFSPSPLLRGAGRPRKVRIHDPNEENKQKKVWTHHGLPPATPTVRKGRPPTPPTTNATPIVRLGRPKAPPTTNTTLSLNLTPRPKAVTRPKVVPRPNTVLRPKAVPKPNAPPS